MKPYPTAYMPAPQIQLDGEGHVSSTQFDDVYFSRTNGEAETQHVFLTGNQLPDRFRDGFTIGELGFGTGLNFLVAWKEFRRTDPAAHLHFISVEKYPLTLAQMRTIHGDAPWLKYYPLRLPGWHRITLDGVTLTLGFGDAESLLSTADAQIDAWFLDGFAPAKNPEMWSNALFQSIARLSAPDATFATFTAAGFVKRGLSAVGFEVKKVQGFAHKRDMLVGRKNGEAKAVSARSNKATVIGGGIAGCTTARALAERGWRVTLYEKNTVASSASGNPAAVLYPQITKNYTPAVAWHALGYATMLRNLARWKEEGLHFTGQQPGMLRMLREGDAQTMLAQLRIDPGIAQYISQPEASERIGTPVKGDGIWFPHGSWINPGELCRALLQHKNITLHENTHITEFPHHADAVILCTAYTKELLPADLPIGKSAGQVTHVSKATLTSLNAIVSHRGYVVPLAESYLIGATYDHEDFSCSVTEENHHENLDHARAALPGWIGNAMPQAGRTSIRATTPDRLPYVGEIAPGIFVNIGHGSRGMVSAPLAAQVIAAQLNGELVPLTPELKEAVNPLRRQKAKKLPKILPA